MLQTCMEKKNKYRKSLEIAMKREIRAIVNRGDMLPKIRRGASQNNRIYQKGFLSNYSILVKRTYLNMLGNDNLLSVNVNRLVGDSQMS